MSTMSVRLRETIESDIADFFDHQRDPDAIRMAAFTSRDPNDRDAFVARWARARADDTVVARTIDEAV